MFKTVKSLLSIKTENYSFPLGRGALMHNFQSFPDVACHTPKGDEPCLVLMNILWNNMIPAFCQDEGENLHVLVEDKDQPV